MADEPALIFDPFSPADVKQFVEDQIVAFNIAMSGAAGWQPVGYFLRNERGEYLGGCLGYIWGGWIHVQWLWVAEAWRGRGQGMRLLNAAETLAVEHGARAATLETHNQAAMAFYLRRGYTVAGQIEDYPPGFTKYLLRKTLVEK